MKKLYFFTLFLSCAHASNIWDAFDYLADGKNGQAIEIFKSHPKSPVAWKYLKQTGEFEIIKEMLRDDPPV